MSSLQLFCAASFIDKNSKDNINVYFPTFNNDPPIICDNKEESHVIDDIEEFLRNNCVCACGEGPSTSTSSADFEQSGHTSLGRINSYAAELEAFNEQFYQAKEEAGLP